MDAKLDHINQQLIIIAVKDAEKDRNDKAANMLDSWRDFNTNYCDPLDKRIKQYEAKITNGISSWWGQSSHDGVNLLYTKLEDGSFALTYSKAGYAEGFPVTADNGEKIEADRCGFGIRAVLLQRRSR